MGFPSPTALQLTMPKDPKNAPESDDDLEIGEVEATQDATAKEHAKAVKKAGKEEEVTLPCHCSPNSFLLLCSCQQTCRQTRLLR